MATTARAVSGLDVSGPDAMDLHSDSGYDFGDGDIELELDTGGSLIPEDDDLSIHDAGTDNGLDVQTASADNDDFMADNEDLIEEDMNGSNEQSSAFHNNQESLNIPVSQQQSLVPPEEDLIDYSDDEGLQQNQGQDIDLYQEDSRQEHIVPNEDDTIQQSPRRDNAETFDPANENQEQGYGQEEEQVEEQESKETNQNNLEVTDQDQQQVERTDWEQEHLTADQGNEPYEQGDELQEAHLYADETVDPHNDAHGMERNQTDKQAHAEEDNQVQDDQALLPPITVNYSGNEFWLFRQHDADGSGDWLLEDISLAQGEISHVFRACRTSLGQDITVEIELGFRFDHMHNMELYEDNTVCAYVTLQRLVDLYHTLLTQDDIADPEPFYITLQFRPRFFTLLGEMEKYAQQGNGFMKLNSDIAAGATHFSNVFSTASTEHGYEQWDDEGEESEEKEEDEHNGDEAQLTTQGDEYRDEHEEEHEEFRDEQQNEEIREEHLEGHQNEGTNAERSPSQEHDEQHESLMSYPETTNITSNTGKTSQTVNTQENANSPVLDVNQSDHESASASGSHADEGDDLIDYSDDEGAGQEDEADHVSREESSTSSSTVQGEESLNPATDVIEELTNAADPTESGGQSSQEYDENDDDEDADPEDFSAQYADLDAPDNAYHGQNYGEEPYQGEEQEYNSPERLEAYEPNENQEYSAQPDLEGDTNEYYGDPGDETAEEQIFSTLPVDVENNDATGAVNSTIVDGLVDVGDFLSVGGATLPGLDDNLLSTFPEDSVDILDPSAEFLDQDGVVEQAAVTASAVAEPISASSVELKDLSPQGQKRTIDEVGNDGGDASDSTDAKRPRV